MNKMKNPIIPGFYPDPTICRVGDDYYLACSSFELCPGIPVFHSRDLVHWEQICNAMTEKNGLHLEKNAGNGGLMAPTLRYNRGKFYIINANFSDKGNYIITAENPEGPWSDPHWLEDVPGIDASLFFDNDDKCYIIGTGNVWDNGTGVKERGIWLAEYDIDNFRMLGEPVTIFNSALRVGEDPESPHIYHIGEYYYLMIAEGGTEHFHAVMVARSKELMGFYEGCPANPIMTHRHMGWNAPIVNVGHADLVELPDGSWYAVLLASRTVKGYTKNLGRETFICPVVWERGWPLFSPETGKLEEEYEAPSCLPWTKTLQEPEFDDFDEDALAMYWTHWGTPYKKYYQIKNSRLRLQCISQKPDEELLQEAFNTPRVYERYAAVVGRRQKDMDTIVTCKMEFYPKDNECAGLIVYQAMNHQLRVERVVTEGIQYIQVLEVTSDFESPTYIPGFTSVTHRCVLEKTQYDEHEVVMQIHMEHQNFKISYGKTKEQLKEFCKYDGERLNPEKVGCMTGTMVGMFASGNGKDSDNHAEFDWFEMKKE